MGRTEMRLAVFALLLASTSSLPNKDHWDIYSFHINSTVTNRYATTVITSRVANRMDEAKEIEFHVQIPKNAFISKFRMFIDDQAYDGVVKTKEKAQQQYTEAVNRGQSAGIVRSVGRTLEEFRTSVNVAAHKKVTFELTYEELMKRTLGKYELKIHAQPMQPVRDFKADVYIHETSSISFIEVAGGLSTKELANAITKTHSDKQAWVHFYPTVNQQKSCIGCGEEGLNGDLIITYDVERDAKGGSIKTRDGYFVHHFAPATLPRIPKNVVFIIDRSGSMHGKKMKQTRSAMLRILDDLVEEDFFGLITFDGEIDHWKRELVPASQSNVENAKVFAENIHERGATDINGAVLEGAAMLTRYPTQGSANILILLTDGDPTSGETNREAIQGNVRRAIAGKFPLYCLGFGYDVHFEFLQKMSLENNGVARRIYEDSDADLQLTGFYEEVATPLLTDVSMTYVGASNLTQTNFSQYYNGSEIVVAGHILDNDIDTFVPEVVAISRRTKMTFPTVVSPIDDTTDGVMERVWAYLTVKQLLEKQLLLSGPGRKEVEQEALRLSLKYSFVTPLTSMVVTKPQGEDTEVLHKPNEEDQETGSARLFHSHGMSYSQGIRPGGSSNNRQYFLGGRHMGLPGIPARGGKHMGLPGIPAQAPNGRGLGAMPGIPSQAQPMPAVYADEVDYRDYDAPTSTPIHSYDTPMILSALDGPRYDDQMSVRATSAPRYDDQMSVRATSAPPLKGHRFLRKSETPALPLCFDISGTQPLKLLHHPSRDIYVNGELNQSEGFSKIVIHIGSDRRLEVDLDGITAHQGQTETRHEGVDPVTVGNATILRSNNEIDIEAEDMRLIIHTHRKRGRRFLWPVLRQVPAENTEGLLVLNPVAYNALQTAPQDKLMINNIEVAVVRSNTVDYSVKPPARTRCLLASADLVLQRPLGDYFVLQL